MTGSRVAHTEQDDETVENENSLDITCGVGGEDETRLRDVTIIKEQTI